ncbi:hypothetical protein NJB14197_30390 [Mycobacterium montefiorense]|uniref:Uncharacterized protein n=1 Tax=Mycobacterium montefiorense TaxID=154654 RepID=A0AA37PMS9_9MYCO|nr:hypothetical protein MmonteBS_03770 [Mycobacterium montefiorense]GKU34005.1 hypothetical protein NJB14191_13510 [Mycobacterium montefiorense]GKU41403.1 hypothetical protein NJB14192_33870 [Mycobacterium montefiorense]GKU47501.1 hypothetical protein NJB14194_41190 [Mycobacterium montefiorense]GKU52299.1 hypothetical protein NJB14195_35430 [Mycobacterium montefiorense]
MIIHATYGVAAVAIAAEAGPCHSSSVNAESTVPYDSAVDRNSAANELHADAATNKDSDPTPEYIRAELTSGGSTAKSNAAVTIDSVAACGNCGGTCGPARYGSRFRCSQRLNVQICR